MASELLVSAISKSLDGLVMRQEVTAQNIANANSPGYVPLRVTFEEALASAVTAASAGRGAANEVAAVRPQVVQDPLSVADEPMRLDQEIASTTQTSMRYSALISVLDRLFDIKNVILSGS